MNARTIHLERWAAWAPGLETAAAVASWARGEARIRISAEAPALEFLPALFRRRLSQLSRMTLEVGHRLAGDRPVPCVFCSHYGEINKQHVITTGLLDAGEVSPAQFALSVFNTPAYLLSLAERDTAPHSAVYAGEHGLSAGWLDALGYLDHGAAGDRCLLIFADEAVPADYRPLFPEPSEPYAFGLTLSSRPAPGSRPLLLAQTPAAEPGAAVHPLALLRWLAAGLPGTFAFGSPGLSFTLDEGIA
jgi:hypothetical protein